MSNAIGGYFELEVPFQEALYPSALGYNSARYAFQALLAHGDTRRLHLPWYTCGTMVEAARRSGVEVLRYRLDDQLQPARLPSLDTGERFLYVNYFGYKAPFIEAELAPRYPGQLIADHAQALFAAPLSGVPTLYSPRKFMGVPDGGWLVNAPPALRAPDPTRSKGRFAALLGRLEDGPEPWYASYVEVERGIRDEGMRGMSILTERLLEGIDYQAIATRRHANLACLHAAFAGRNRYELPMHSGLAPMCYPLLLESASEAERVRAQLARQRIYTATYWKDVLEADGDCDVARRWSTCMLPLPLDQRNGPVQMARLIEAVNQALG